MKIPEAPGGEVTKSELLEWIVMIAVIISWWPRFFLGWDNPIYLIVIYLVGPAALVLIFVRRWRRMHEGLDYSKNIIDAQHQAREEAERAAKAQRKARRKS